MAWELLNSPFFLTCLGSVIVWLFSQLLTRNAWLGQYRGAIIAFIRTAEKAIPDDIPNKGLARLDYVLRNVLQKLEADQGKPPTTDQANALAGYISELHNLVFPTVKRLSAFEATVTKLPLLAMAVALPFMSGCWNAPEPVLKGHDTAAACVAKANEISAMTHNAMAATLRAERAAHADFSLEQAYAAVLRDGQANNGKVDASKALEYIRTAHASRERAVRDMEERIARIQEARLAAERETRIALQLLGELRAYDAAGVDPLKTAESIAGAVPALKTSEIK